MNQNCQWCGKSFRQGWGAKRYGAKFCNDECRTNYHNAKKKVRQQEHTAFMLIEFFHDMAKKEGELGAAAKHALTLISKNSAPMPSAAATKPEGMTDEYWAFLNTDPVNYD